MKNTTLIVLAILFLCAFTISGFTSKKNNPLPTSLKITVLNGLGHLVEGAKVTIYITEEDFKNSENPAQDPMFTNEKGVVQFKDIEAISYFVDVSKDKMTNYGEAQQTPVLQAGKVNKVNIIID